MSLSLFLHTFLLHAREHVWWMIYVFIDYGRQWGHLGKFMTNKTRLEGCLVVRLGMKLCLSKNRDFLNTF